MSALAGRKAHVRRLGARRCPRPRPRAGVAGAVRTRRLPCSAARSWPPSAAAPSPATRSGCPPSRRIGPAPASTATARRCRSAFAGPVGRLSDADQAMLTAAAGGRVPVVACRGRGAPADALSRAAPERTWPLAAELSHAIRRVADAVVAHAAGTDAQTRRINDSYAAFRRSAVGADAGDAIA